MRRGAEVSIEPSLTLVDPPELDPGRSEGSCLGHESDLCARCLRRPTWTSPCSSPDGTQPASRPSPPATQELENTSIGIRTTCGWWRSATWRPTTPGPPRPTASDNHGARGHEVRACQYPRTGFDLADLGSVPPDRATGPWGTRTDPPGEGAAAGSGWGQPHQPAGRSSNIEPGQLQRPRDAVGVPVDASSASFHGLHVISENKDFPAP